MLVVQRLAGVLLEMHPLDADAHLLEAAGLVRPDLDHDRPLAHDRLVVLRDLVALRQVRIEVVLPREDRAVVDLRLQAEPGADRLPDAFLVDDRQHARHRRVDEAHMAVRRAAESRRRAGEKLRLRGDLGMHLHADDDLPVAGGAADQVFRIGVAGLGDGHSARRLVRPRRNAQPSRARPAPRPPFCQTAPYRRS